MTRRFACLFCSAIAIAACGGTDVHTPDGGSGGDAHTIDASTGTADASADGGAILPDAATSDATTTTIDAATGTGVCGNGTLEPPEECDDGNTMPGDGCSPGCQVEAMCGSTVTPLATGAKVIGSTAGLSNVSQGSCGGGSSGEQIYQFTVYDTTGVSITTDFPETDFNTAIYIRSDCGNPGTQLACASNGMLGDTVMASLSPGTYYVFVDGIAGMSGNFGLQVNLTPVLPAGSPCDPTGVMNTCAPGLTCIDSGGGPVCTDPAAVCTMLAMPITGDGTPVTGTTIGAVDGYTPGCSPDGMAGDNTWILTVPPGGSRDLVVNAVQTNFMVDAFDIILSVTTACGDASTELACADSPGAAANESVTIPGIAPGTYFITVDGYNGHAGAYSLTATLHDNLATGDPCDITSTTSRCGAGDWCYGTPSTCQTVTMITDTPPNATFCAAQGPTATDLVVDGQMNGATDPDNYSITLAAPFTAMHAYTDDGFGGCAADTTIDIYSAMGMTCMALDGTPQTAIATDTDSGPGSCSDVTATGLAAGTYYVRVTWGGMATGPYHLVVDLQ